MSKEDPEAPNFDFVTYKPSFTKALKKVVDFANIHADDESALQSYGQYRSFKRKKLNIDHREGIACLVKLLWGYKFYEEHIFWSKRFLEMTCSKEGTCLLKYIPCTLGSLLKVKYVKQFRPPSLR